MKVLLISWLANAIALYLVSRFLPGVEIRDLVPAGGGFITTQGMVSVLIGGGILGVFNSLLTPVLKFFSLPLTCLTLGLFSFIITGAIFYLGSVLTPGMHVDSFWWAILGGVVFGIVNSLISGLLGVEKKEK